MEDRTESFTKAFFQTLENSIGKLSEAKRDELFRPCAEQCVQGYVLKEQRRQFAACNGDLDLQYEKYGRSDYFFADIIERGRVYEIGYPRCLCPMVQAGLAASPVHCACSRQSILCVLKTLLPGRDITVELLHTVLGGADECRFRVTLG